MSIGDNIKRIRKEKGLKAKDLADLLGVSPSVVSQWENEKDPAKYETIKRIADALDVDFTDLVPVVDLSRPPATEEEKKAIEKAFGRKIDFSKIWKLHFTAEEWINDSLSKLNTKGKNEAAKRVHELTLISEYTEKEE